MSLRLSRHAVRFLATVALTASAALGAAGQAAAATSSATTACTPAPTDGTVTRALGARSYELHVPQGLTGEQVPLLLSLHGFGADASQQERFTRWSGFADEQGFIVAYPNARGLPGSGAWDPYTQGSPDVAFLRGVVEDISSRWCVEPDRVHVDGWSNGAVMSQRAACEAADTFASVVSYGGGTPTPPGTAACRPTRPISVALFVGQFDFTLLGLGENTQEWLDYDGCAPSPTSTTDPYGTTDRYGCAAGTEVLARVVGETSHNWPSGARGEDQRARMWAFLAAHPRP